MDQALERRGLDPAAVRSGKRSGGSPHAALARIAAMKLAALT
jgi:hypothetical protein